MVISLLALHGCARLLRQGSFGQLAAEAEASPPPAAAPPPEPEWPQRPAVVPPECAAAHAVEEAGVPGCVEVRQVCVDQQQVVMMGREYTPDVLHPRWVGRPCGRGWAAPLHPWQAGRPLWRR